MIISVRNWLDDLDPSTDIEIPTTGIGYEAASLWRGGIARVWRAAASAAEVWLEFGVGADRPVDLVAFFDVRGGSTVELVDAQLYRRGTLRAGVWTHVGAISFDAERGDGAIRLPVPIGSASWALKLTLASPALLSVGGVWMGLAASLPKQPSRISTTIAGNTIVNETDARTRSRARLASPTRSFSLEWSALEQDEGDELVTLFADAAGSEAAAVLIPDEAHMQRVYAGILSDSLGWSLDPSQLLQGYALGFLEDGRCVRG